MNEMTKSKKGKEKEKEKKQQTFFLGEGMRGTLKEGGSSLAVSSTFDEEFSITHPTVRNSSILADEFLAIDLGVINLMGTKIHVDKTGENVFWFVESEGAFDESIESDGRSIGVFEVEESVPNVELLSRVLSADLLESLLSNESCFVEFGDADQEGHVSDPMLRVLRL